MKQKICTVEEAVANVHDGNSVAAHVWGPCGTPDYLVRGLVAGGAKNLTFYCENFLPALPGQSLTPDVTVLLPQLKKIVTPFLGARVFRGFMEQDFLGDRIESGDLEVEATTHGVFLERLHAGAMALGGFYSPLGLGTIIEEGKEKRTIDGKEYILEKPICPDVGLIKANKADKRGNLAYRGSARGANPVIAMASKFTMAEVYEIVEVGELDPEAIGTPEIYVDRVVRIPDEDVASAKRRREEVDKFAQDAAARAISFARS